MKPRHAAALALMGWYLMVPPDKPSSFTSGVASIDPSAPLTKWVQINSFDTVAQCRAAQGKASEIAHDPDEIAAQLAKNSHWRPENAQARIAASMCIATDDPRLKGM